MAIALVGVTSGTDPGTGNPTTAEPSGCASGTVLLFIVNNEDNATSVVTPATGWAQVTGLFDEGTGTGQQLMSGVYWIRRGSSAVATNWTISAGGAARMGSIVAYSGVKSTGDPWSGTPVLAVGGASPAVYGSITTDVDGCMIVGLQSVFSWNGAVTGTGGWDERLDQATTGPASIYDQLQTSAGATPALSVAGDDNWVAHLIALAPEAVVPSAPTITMGAGGHEHAAFQWTAGSDGGSAVTDWDIDHATAAAPTTWLGPTATGSTNLYGAVTGLTNTTAYVFRVRAVSAIGPGAWSTTTGSITPTDNRGLALTMAGDHRLTMAGDDVLLMSGAGDTGTPLVVANATHAHTAANTVLTQHQVLTVAAATQAHTAANTVLTQHFTLTVAGATHGHTAAAVALVQHQVLVVANATHGHTAAATVLVQHQVLAVASATHAHTAAAVVLTQHQVLTVADATHGHIVENVALGVTLTVADATHGHTAAAVALTQHQVLAVASATHGHTAAAVALTQHQVLAVAAATHAHTADAVALTQHHTLTVADAAHGHSVESVVVDAHGPGAVTLTVADATHAHSAAAVVLTQHHTLTVASSTHAHTAGAVALVQHHTLTVAGTVHGHTVDNVTLGIGVATLVVANATHGHTAGNVALIQHQVLELADAGHAHTVVNIALLQHFVLIVADAVHAHLGAVVMFVIPDVAGHGTGTVGWRDGAVVTITAKADGTAATTARDTGTGTVAARDGVLVGVGAAHTGTGEVRQP